MSGGENHTLYSAPDMKNARHFLPCPNLCIGYFSVFSHGGMAGQWLVLSSFLINRQSESGRFLYV